MALFDFNDGDLVKIADDISLTNDYYTTTHEMKMMIGKVFRISSVISDEKIRINGYSWHPRDLIPMIDIKDLKSAAPIYEKVLFDPNNLEV